MIPGITTVNRLPRLGKIRLGEKATAASGKQYPKALDHFNFTDCPEVAAVYGADCRELYPVLLPVDDEDIFFPTARKAYRRSGLFCACSDGETATRVFVGRENGKVLDEQGEAFLKSAGQSVEVGEMFEMPCPGDECPYFENKFCKNVGRLMLMLPEVPRFGVYEIATTSFNGMVNILNVSRAVRRAVGTVAGIPFALVLKPLQVQPEGKAKTVYVLDLEYRGTIKSLATLGRQIRAGGGSVLALLGAADDPPDDLYPNAGAALDAKLGGPPVPPASKLAAEPGKGALDALAEQMKPARDNGDGEKSHGPPDLKEPDWLPAEREKHAARQAAANARAATPAPPEESKPGALDFSDF
jgi:Recombination directionality factor-like